MADKLDGAIAASIVGVAIIETSKTYQSAAPKITDLRNSDPNDISTKQSLLDADVYAGTMAVLVGVAASVLMRSYVPGILTAIAFLVISAVHHLVANAERV